MAAAQPVLERHFLEMRARCLSLAADLDRIQRATGQGQLLPADPRLAQLRDAIRILISDSPDRAQQVQLIFSDKTPAPTR